MAQRKWKYEERPRHYRNVVEKWKICLTCGGDGKVQCGSHPCTGCLVCDACDGEGEWLLSTRKMKKGEQLNTLDGSFP